jgi:hypothetical protein
MSAYTLEIDLLSDSTFAKGLGISGKLDQDIQHDELGLPTLSGRSIKGLLVSECAEILFSLPAAHKPKWQAAARRLFGERGEQKDTSIGLRIRKASCAPDLVAAVRAAGLPATQVLESLTAIRRQTAMNIHGAPDDETLRATRVVLRELTLYAPLSFDGDVTPDEKALLAACVLALRRAGLGRNRGRGKIRARITQRSLDPAGFAEDESLSQTNLAITWIDPFQQEVWA